MTQQPSPSMPLLDSFTQLKSAFLDQPEPALRERLIELDAIKRQLLMYKTQLCQAVEQDFGVRPTAETQLAELIPILETLNYIKAHLKQWMRSEKRQVSWLLQPGNAWIHHQPLGVVGIMSPWNYPIQLTLIPLLYALAAGNRVLIKPSEYTPHTTALLQQLFSEIFPQNKVAFVASDNETAQAFSRLPFNHLFFTGATSTGKKIMAAAAEQLTPVTLELGGKSPVIIGTDADLKAACAAIIFGKGMNAGQTCIAPDVLLCPTPAYQQICTELAAAANALYPNCLTNPDYSTIINTQHLARLDHLLMDAEQKGAHIIPLSNAAEKFAPTQKRPITLVSDLRNDMLITRDEIFGPWLTIVTYDTLDEAICYVNQRPQPLALYYFGNKHSEIQAIIHNTRSGGVCINDMLSHFAVTDLPFGGLGASGMGSYHGIEGFRTFSHAKPIFRKKLINPTRWLYPPWNRRIHGLLFKRYF